MNSHMDFLKLPKRPKPRDEGINSFFDYFLPLEEIKNFLEVAAEAMDYAKLIHIGLYEPLPKGWLETKMRMYKANQVKVYPGGVSFQIAAVQNKVPEFLKWLSKHGFDAVEIAEDALPSPLEPKKRDDMVRTALEQGLEVITEIGKKHPDAPLSLEEAYESIQHDLNLGVSHVTLERAELDPYMKDDPSPLKNLVGKVGLKKLLFEPGPFGWPQVHKWCFKTFGPKVNLGNIYKEELLYVEFSRIGLSRLVDYDYFK